MAAKENALQKLEDTFPKTTRVITDNCVNTAYDVVDQFVRTNAPEWLQYQVGRNDRLIPELKNSAVEYQLMNACDKGLLPFNYQVEFNKNKSCKFLKFFMVNKNIILTANQTPSENKTSRDAVYRNDLQNVFQGTLNLFHEDDDENVKYYFEINHGYQSRKPKFSVVGIPNENHDWFARLRLHNQLGVISSGELSDLKTVAHDLKEFSKSDFEEFAHSKDDGQ